MFFECILDKKCLFGSYKKSKSVYKMLCEGKFKMFIVLGFSARDSQESTEFVVWGKWTLVIVLWFFPFKLKFILGIYKF